MVFAFVQVDGHAARIPGSGEISLGQRLERLQRKEKPPRTQRLRRFGVTVFLEVFSASADEISLGLPLFALLEIVAADHEASRVFGVHGRNWFVGDPERCPQRLR